MGSLPANASATLVLIDPTQPTRAYATDTSMLYRSDDAGQTWQPANQGLPDGEMAALALDPRQPQRLYAATNVGALYVSEDGATTWQVLAGAGTDAAS